MLSSLSEAAVGGVLKKAALKNFTKLTGKHLCWSPFFNKAAGLTCNFLEKETPKKVFFCEFCQNFKKTFFVEHHQATASELLSN